MSMGKTAVVTLAALAMAGAALAQGNPRGAASATVGGKKISVDYGRPALKGSSSSRPTGSGAPARTR
jgi:hypothetical protein